MDYYVKVAKVYSGELEIQDGVLEDILPDIFSGRFNTWT